MSTVALLGLLVVLLVAIGIAGFLLRGRGSDRRSDPSAPPRTVAELVDRRRSGTDEPRPDTERVTGPDPELDTGTRPGSAADTEAIEQQDRPGPATEAGAAVVGRRTADESTAGGSADLGSTSDKSTKDDDAGRLGAGAASVTEVGTAAAPGAHSDAESSTTPSPRPRPGSDADTGPASAPWSRGFVAGRQIAPPPPERTPESRATTPSPSPRPQPRTAASTSATSSTSSTADSTADSASAAGPVPTADAASPADSASTSASGTDTAADPSSTPDPTSAAAAASSADPASVTSTASAAGPTPSPAPAGSAAESARPGVPPRQQSQSPVDPDLVKRVTALPSAGGRRIDDPEIEREFREARDRMAGAAGTRPGRVPEQSTRSPEAGTPTPSADAAGSASSGASAPPRPSPRPADDAGSGTAAAVAGGAGLAAVTASVLASRSAGGDEGDADDAVEDPTLTDRPEQATAARPSPARRAATTGGPAGGGEEPPPRPTPRVMRSATPGPDGPAAGGPGDAVDAPGPGPGGDDAPRALPDPDGPAPSVAAATDASTASRGPGPAPRAPTTPAPTTAAPAPVVAFSAPSAARRDPVPSSPAQDVEVQVADGDARPLPGVTLSMVDGSGVPAGSASTGAAGDARLRAPGAGQYVVVASAAGFQTRVTPCAVADEPVRVAVTLSRASTVHGAVRSASGEPRPGVPVVLEQDGDTLDTTGTGSDGTFRFTDLDAGHYRLVAGDGPAVTVLVRPGADVEQDLGEAAGAGVAATGDRT